MSEGNTILFDENTVFRSLGKGELSFKDVFNEIINYIKDDKNSSYKISIGTDSQVSSKTFFVTCIHVHRVGKIAIGFYTKAISKTYQKLT